jgi:hypothetical protein
MNAKPEAKVLPISFDSLAKECDESQLVRCETKENKKWRRASASAAANGITEMAKYFPELLYLRLLSNELLN